MTLTQLLIAALSTWEAVEIWRHSHLLSGWRSYTQEAYQGKLGQLLKCPFCMSPWVGLLFTVVLLWPTGPFSTDSFLSVVRSCVDLLFLGLRVFVVCLAVARLANLGNDLTYHWCRTPRDDQKI